MTLQITKLVSLFTVAVVTLIASQAKADVYDHIDQQAVTIQQKTRLLLNETIHYRHTAEYGRLVTCTNELNRLAAHVHDVTHFEGNLTHLQADLSELDSQFHSLEGLFDTIERRASYGRGHIHGNTSHVKDLLDCIEDSIHHMQEDVDSLINPVRVCPHTGRPIYTPVVVIPTRPVYVPTRRPVYTPSRPVYTPSRPVYTPSRPVYVPVQTRSAVNIQFNKNRSGHGGHGHGRTVERGHGHSSRGSRSSGSNRGGITIGGGSSKIHIRF